MADYFMGQVMMTGFGYAPKYFAQCNGAMVAINQNQALFSLLGITYGGDGTSTFALPDLRGRTPVGGGFGSVSPGWQPAPYGWGQIGGVEQVSLTPDQNAQHTHLMAATTAGASATTPSGSEIFAQTSGPMVYGPPQTLLPLGGGGTSPAGAGAAHANMQPFETINFNIALNGIYPSRS